MKRALLLILALSSGFASAGTITTPTGLDNALTAALPRVNAWTCVHLGLPVGCSNAQVQALDNSQTIYANTNALAVGLMVAYLTQLKATYDTSDQQSVISAEAALASPSSAQCAAVGLANGCTATQVKNQMCAALGLASGCLP